MTSSVEIVIGLYPKETRAVVDCCKAVYCKDTSVSKGKESKVLKSMLKAFCHRVPIRSKNSYFQLL